MRQSMFGDWYIESESDDLAEALENAGADLDDIFAEISQDEEDGDTKGKWFFEVRTNEDGERVLASDSIFPSREAAFAYLRRSIEDIQ